MDALRLLEGEVDVAFFGLSLAAHDLDLIARLELRLTLVIQHFGQGQHAFRLCADIDDDMSRRELQDRALNDTIFADRLFGLGGEGFQHRGEVLSGYSLVLGSGSGLGVDWLIRIGGLILFWLLLLHRRLGFSSNSGGGVLVVGGGFVEQDYASLVIGCGTCLADCWMSRLVVVGSPWRVSFNNPSCRKYYKETT